MSLKSLCELHTCTLFSETTTRGGSGGTITTPSTGVANCKCRIVPASADLEATFAKAGMSVDYQVFFVYNPRTKTAGLKVKRIKFTDENGDTRTLKVNGEKNPDQANRFWRYDCEEFAGVENR